MEKAYARFLALRRKVMAGIKKALEIDCFGMKKSDE